MTFTRGAAWVVGMLGIAVAVVSMIPETRLKIRSLFASAYEREVLATADGDVLNNGKPVKVIKYKGPDNIFVEIVDPMDSKLIARIVLPDKKDGLFNMHGRVTRLAIADIDGDGTNELLIPTFDDQLVPHLNIYRYNPQTQRFDAVKPP